MLIALLSAAPAYGKASAQLLDSSARAGDVVHFSITGAAAGVSYQVEVGDQLVQDGTGRGQAVPGAFTVPDLGDDARTVEVEIAISGPGKPRTVDRDLGYLGRALTGTRPPIGVVPGPAPGVAPQTSPAPVPSPVQSSKPAPSPVQSSIQSLVQQGPNAAAIVQRALQRAAARGEHPRSGPRAHSRHARHAPGGTLRSKHVPAGAHHARHAAARHIVCPCRFGHLEAAQAAKPGRHITRGSPEPTTVPTAIKDVRVDGGGFNAAAVVPALAALAALALGATAMARKRRVTVGPSRS